MILCCHGGEIAITMNYNSLIQTSIDKIENDLLEIVTIDNLADSLFISKYYYQRLFRSIVGDSVMDYVKKRRLTLAGKELCETNTNIINIALKYGYSSHESFTRAFKSFHGVTPTDCRKYTIYHSFNKISMEKELLTMTAKNEISNCTGEIIKLLTNFIVNSEKVGNTMADKAERVNLNNFQLIAEQTLLLSSQIKIAIDEIRSSQNDKSNEFSMINERFRIIKIIEDIGFQTNILAFNTSLHIARTTMPLRSEFSDIDNEYHMLANYANDISSKINQIFHELAVLISKDASKQCLIETKNALAIFDELVKKINSVSSYINDEAVNQHEHGRSFVIIFKEVQYIADDLVRIAKAARGFYENPSHFIAFLDENIAIIDDLSFRINLLSFDARLELTRGSEKNLVSAVYQLADIRDDIEKSKQDFIESIETIKQLEKISSLENINFTDKHTLKKTMTDISFQACILYYYTKMEFAKFGFHSKNVTDEQSENFKLILQDISDITGDINKSIEYQDKSIIQNIYNRMAKTTTELHNFGTSIGDIGGAITYISSEFQHLTNKITIVI